MSAKLKHVFAEHPLVAVATIVAAMITCIGASFIQPIVAGVIGIREAEAPVRLSIQATQTAEARSAPIPTVATGLPLLTPQTTDRPVETVVESPTLALFPTPIDTSTPFVALRTEPQQVRWGPVDGFEAGICANSCTEFIPWIILKDEIQIKLLPQVARIPYGSIVELRDLAGRKEQKRSFYGSPIAKSLIYTRFSKATHHVFNLLLADRSPTVNPTLCSSLDRVNNSLLSDLRKPSSSLISPFFISALIRCPLPIPSFRIKRHIAWRFSQ